MENHGLDDYQILRSLGVGGFAKVYAAQHNTTKNKVAIKVISKYQNNEDGNQLARIYKEIEIMKKANHPFIAEFYESIETDDFVYIVQELAKNGTLLDYINTKGPLSEVEGARVFAQLALAIKFLHKDLNIAHRDIKAENILFDSYNNVRLIDFGLSHGDANLNILKTQCGSPTYAAPEIILGNEYSYSCDIWSLGVVLYAMLTGSLPFMDDNMQRLAQKIVYKEIEFPPFLSQPAMSLISSLLTKNQKNRVTIDDVLKHPFISHFVTNYEEKIHSFVKNDEYIFGTMEILNMDLEQVKKDLHSEKTTNNTVSYHILSRVFMNEAMNLKHPHCMDCNVTRQRRRASYNDCENLPPLDVKDSVLSSIKRGHAHQTNNSIINKNRRKYPLPQIHLKI